MSKELTKAFEELDLLEAMADQMKIKARGLRKKLLHFNAGASPKRVRISKEVQASVIGGLRNSINRKNNPGE